MIDENKLKQDIKDYLKAKIDKYGNSEMTIDVLDLNVDIMNIIESQPKTEGGGWKDAMMNTFLGGKR